MFFGTPAGWSEAVGESNAAAAWRWRNRSFAPRFQPAYLTTPESAAPKSGADSAATRSAWFPSRQKATPSSFVGTELEAQLNASGIKQLIVSGLMTPTTARDAVPKGFNVIIPDDACATRDVAGWDGEIVGHQDLHRAALTAVGDAVAEVMSTAEVTARTVR